MPNDGLDLLVQATPSEFSQVIGKADDLITQALASNSPAMVFEEISFLRRDTQMRHVLIAKLLSDLEKNWKNIEGVDPSMDAFMEAATAETGLAARTIQPYIRMWRAIFENKKVPSTMRQTMLAWDMRTLNYIGPSAGDGTLDGKWDDLKKCATPAEVKSLVRDLRGARTSSSSAVHIYLGRDGRLKTRRGSAGKYTDVGYLNVKTDDELALIAINRIINAAGIVELD